MPFSSEVFSTNKVQQALMNGAFITESNEKINLSDILAIQNSPQMAFIEYNPFKNKELKQNVLDFVKS